MITTQKEKAFASELKLLMAKYSVRIEVSENYNSESEVIEITDRKFVGPDIDITIDDLEIYRIFSELTHGNT